jgi:hypothetical protein
MSEMERIAEALRKEAAGRAGEPPGERRAALLDVLRRELDPLPPRELYEVLVEIRATLAPDGAETEASQLWECVASLAASGGDTGRQRAVPPPAAAAAGDGMDRLAAALLGKELPAGTRVTAEMQERIIKVLEALVQAIDRSQDAFQFLNMELRRSADRKSSGTMQVFKEMDSIRKVLARSVLQSGDASELEERMKKLGGSAIVVHQAYKAGIHRGLEAVRKLLDPQVIERDHGKDPKAWWLAYRRIYKNEAYDFGTDFRIIFLEKTFLDEYFDRIKKL